jgi:hypothetical protein
VIIQELLEGLHARIGEEIAGRRQSLGGQNPDTVRGVASHKAEAIGALAQALAALARAAKDAKARD